MWDSALLKLLDMLLGGALERWRQKQALARQFNVLRRNVVYCGITNNIPVELHRLREFLVAEGLVERPQFRQFFDRWLSNPFVVMGVSVAPYYAALQQLTVEKWRGG